MSGDGTPQPSNVPAIPAGWYSDPAGGAGKRWWDGSRWTENIREPETPLPAPAVGNYAPGIGRYVPGEARPTRALPHAEAGIAYTRTSWWLAGSPLWISVPEVIVFAIINSLVAPAPSAIAIGFGLVNLLAWAALVGMAFADRAALFAGGNDSAASPWWTLLTPLAYLIARARHVRLYATGGWASVIWWIVAAILAPGVAILGFFAAVGIFTA
jgi:Protein of unknown function (DUF2510)